MADCKRCDICWGHFNSENDLKTNELPVEVPVSHFSMEKAYLAPMWGMLLLRSDSSKVNKIDICPSCVAKIKKYILDLIESSSD